MKKTYIAPETELQTINVEQPLAGSGVHSDEIGWGGVDDGSNDPDVKEDNDWDIWNDKNFKF